jgi:hypothetical protein
MDHPQTNRAQACARWYDCCTASGVEALSMKKQILIGTMMLFSACAGTKSQIPDGGMSERWRGYVLRDGLQVPVVIDLARTGGDRMSRLWVGDRSVPLEHVRITPLGVHFDVPGEGTFDGSVAGDQMAGFISGVGALGAFELRRDPGQASADVAGGGLRGSSDFDRLQ